MSLNQHCHEGKASQKRESEFYQILNAPLLHLGTKHDTRAAESVYLLSIVGEIMLQ